MIFLLRLSLAFSFLYPAYGFWKSPSDWLGYIPGFVRNFGLTETVLLGSIMAFHIILAIWILSGWKIMLPSIIASVFLLSVVYFNQNQINILFRDISLALVALALAFSRPRS